MYGIFLDSVKRVSCVGLCCYVELPTYKIGGVLHLLSIDFRMKLYRNCTELNNFTTF